MESYRRPEFESDQPEEVFEHAPAIEIKRHAESGLRPEVQSEFAKLGEDFRSKLVLPEKEALEEELSALPSSKKWSEGYTSRLESLKNFSEYAAAHLELAKDDRNDSPRNRYSKAVKRAYYGMPDMILNSLRILDIGESLRDRRAKGVSTREEEQAYAELFTQNAQWQADAVWATVMQLNMQNHSEGKLYSVLQDMYDMYSFLLTGEDDPDFELQRTWGGVISAARTADRLAKRGYTAALAPPHWDAFGKIDLLVAPTQDVERGAISSVGLVQAKSVACHSPKLAGSGQIIYNIVPRESLAKYAGDKIALAQTAGELRDVRKWEKRRDDDNKAMDTMTRYASRIQRTCSGWDKVDVKHLMCYTLMSTDSFKDPYRRDFIHDDVRSVATLQRTFASDEKSLERKAA